MNSKHIKSRSQKVEIPKESPFLNDKLDRARLSDVLTDIASFYGQSGCVMALNGEWGAGKTTFVKMWSQQLKNLEYKTLYFNAWTTDYSNDALMAIVSELKELSPQNDAINRIAFGAARIGLSVAKGLLKKATGIDSEELESAISETTEIGKEYLKEFATQKATIEEFKQQVKQYVADNAVKHPLVFFIDELDRCNPHYAVAVLERIKHLFDIPNIIFILAINKVELGNAIQGYFGSANIDSNEYLRRFVDIEYTLPPPNMKEYCEHLYNEYGFDDFFNSKERQQNFRNDRENESFKTIAHNLCEIAQPNLRQIDRIYAYARLALMQFAANSYLIPDVYFLLCFWKIMNPIFYNEIREKKYTLQKLLSKLEEVFLQIFLIKNNNYYRSRNTIFVIAKLIYCYDVTSINNYPSNPTLVTTELNGKKDYSIKTTSIDKELFNEALDYYYTRTSQKYNFGLSLIFNRIDLLETFK